MLLMLVNEAEKLKSQIIHNRYITTQKTTLVLTNLQFSPAQFKLNILPVAPIRITFQRILHNITGNNYDRNYVRTEIDSLRSI